MNLSQESLNSLSDDEDDDRRFKRTCLSHQSDEDTDKKIVKSDCLLRTTKKTYEKSPNSEPNQLEREKQLVYRHPLFPLLALLLEKCEITTASLGTKEDVKLTKESFNSEIEAFISHQQKENKPLLGDNHEVDELMMTAIQVLRIHLHELEKVQDLCKEFCQRYIFCLRAKMTSENLLRDGVLNYDSSSCSSDADECSSSSSSFPISNHPNDDFTNSSSSSIPKSFAGSIGNRNFKSHKSAGSEKYKSLIAHHSSKNDSGSDGDISDEASNVPLKKNQKRGILPKQATTILRSWLFQHILHPYPTEDEKKAIAAETNLTLLQINNWFINARRRILQPMLDSANISGNNSNRADTKPLDDEEADKESPASPFHLSKSNSNTTAFWPESMTAILKVTSSLKNLPSK